MFPITHDFELFLLLNCVTYIYLQGVTRHTFFLKQQTWCLEAGTGEIWWMFLEPSNGEFADKIGGGGTTVC